MNKPLSGAQKRKKAQELKEKLLKLPKVTNYFSKSEVASSSISIECTENLTKDNMVDPALETSGKYFFYLYFYFFINKTFIL